MINILFFHEIFASCQTERENHQIISFSMQDTFMCFSPGFIQAFLSKFKGFSRTSKIIAYDFQEQKAYEKIL